MLGTVILPQYETVLIAAGNPQIITCGFDPTQVLPWFPESLRGLHPYGVWHLSSCMFLQAFRNLPWPVCPAQGDAGLAGCGPGSCPEAQLTWWSPHPFQVQSWQKRSFLRWTWSLPRALLVKMPLRDLSHPLGHAGGLRPRVVPQMCSFFTQAKLFCMN